MSIIEKPKFNPRDTAVDKIVGKLERDPGLWSKAWIEIGRPDSRPHNPITKTYYKGMNMITLAISSMERGFEDNRWCTYDQAKNAGHPVTRGETSPGFVVYHQIAHNVVINEKSHIIKNVTELEACERISSLLLKYYPYKSPEINELLQNAITGKHLHVSKSEFFVEQCKKRGMDVKQDIKAVARYSPVFNFSQMENVPQKEVQYGYDWDPSERAENILKSSGVKLVHDQFDKNFYLMGHHEIHLTIKSAFKDQEAYYSTALHELSHSKMSDGSMSLSFNPEDYLVSPKARAAEELRVELSSVFLCAEIGLKYDVQNHAAYLHTWLNSFKENKQELWLAIAESNRVTDAILTQEHKYNLEHNINTNNLPIVATLSIRGNDYNVCVENPAMHAVVINMVKLHGQIDNKEYYCEFAKVAKTAKNILGDNFIKLVPNVVLDHAVIDSATRIINVELENSLQHTSKIIPPFMSYGMYSSLIEKVTLVVNEISNISGNDLNTNINQYCAENNNSLISDALIKIDRNQFNPKEVIKEILIDCQELASQLVIAPLQEDHNKQVASKENNESIAERDTNARLF